MVWIRFTRLPLALTAVSNIWTAVWLVDMGNAPLLLALAFSAILLYAFGMGSNDLFDLSRDRKLAPERVLPSGALGVPTAINGLWVFFVLALGCAYLAHPACLIPALLTALLALTYNAWLKHAGLLGALNMGAVRGALIFFGLTAVPGLGVWSWWHLAAVTLYGTLVTVVSLREEANPKAKQTVFRLLLCMPLVDAVFLVLAQAWVQTVVVLVFIFLMYLQVSWLRKLAQRQKA